MHGQIGQNLPVNLNTRQAKPIDKARIGHRLIMTTHGCVDPLDPQGPKVALPVMPVAGCILIGFINRLRRDFKRVLTTSIIAFRSFYDFLVTGVGYGTTFNA